MVWEDVVEQLAFGKTTRRVGACLGLYLSPEAIILAQTRLDGGKIAVEHLARVPLSVSDAAARPGGPATSSLSGDFLNDPAKVGAAIRQSMSAIAWSSKDVVVTLSHHLGLLRYFATPAMDRRYWKTAVPLEAKKYIPIPFDALAYDYQIVPVAPDSARKPRQGTLVAVTQKRNLANVVALLEELGLSFAGMEIAPCSVLRLWESLEKNARGRAHGQVHFDGGNIRILLADEGLPVFFREIFLGREAGLSDLRKVDLGGCVTFAQKQLAVGPLTQLRVSGADASLTAWQEAFGQELGLPVAVQDTAALLGLKAADWGGLAAIGASVRFSAPTTITLDLGKVGKISDDEKRTATDIFLAGALLTAWLLVVGLFRSVAYSAKARELAQFKRDAEVEQIFAGKSREDVEQMFNEMRLQIKLTSGLSREAIHVGEILKEIAESLPEKVWLTHITISNPMEGDDKTGPTLDLTGHAVAATVGQEQDLALRFRDRLRAAKALGRLFPDIQMSFPQKSAAQESWQALGPDELAQKLEQRTTFALSGKSAK